jgi:hypothetical protein
VETIAEVGEWSEPPSHNTCDHGDQSRECKQLTRQEREDQGRRRAERKPGRMTKSDEHRQHCVHERVPVAHEAVGDPEQRQQGIDDGRCGAEAQVGKPTAGVGDADDGDLTEHDPGGYGEQ